MPWPIDRDAARGDGQPRKAVGVPPRVLVVDADAAMAALIEEWLSEAGCVVMHDGDDAGPQPPYDLAIIDVPYVRLGGHELVRRFAEAHPGIPIVALSTTLFPRVEACGPVARALGADCVLAKPASRQALTAAVKRLLDL